MLCFVSSDSVSDSLLQGRSRANSGSGAALVPWQLKGHGVCLSDKQHRARGEHGRGGFLRRVLHLQERKPTERGGSFLLLSLAGSSLGGGKVPRRRMGRGEWGMRPESLPVRWGEAHNVLGHGCASSPEEPLATGYLSSACTSRWRDWPSCIPHSAGEPKPSGRGGPAAWDASGAGDEA